MTDGPDNSSSVVATVEVAGRTHEDIDVEPDRDATIRCPLPGGGDRVHPVREPVILLLPVVASIRVVTRRPWVW